VFGLPVPIIILVVMATVTLHPLCPYQIREIHLRYWRQRTGGRGFRASMHPGYKMLIYVYASFLAGTGGIGGFVPDWFGGNQGLALATNLMPSRPRSLVGTSLSAGGIGTVAGTIVGALIIGVLNNTS